MAIVKTIAQRTYAAGTHGSPTVSIPSGITHIEVRASNAGWPVAPGLFQGTLSLSHDGGATWANYTVEYDGSPIIENKVLQPYWHIRFGLGHAMVNGALTQRVTGAQTQARFTMKISQPLTTAITAIADSQ